MTLREMDCGRCTHWTKMGKPGRYRLCRHPKHLNNSPENKEDGEEVLLFTGPNCYCEDFQRLGSAKSDTEAQLVAEPELADICNQGYKPGEPVYYDASGKLPKAPTGGFLIIDDPVDDDEAEEIGDVTPCDLCYHNRSDATGPASCAAKVWPRPAEATDECPKRVGAFTDREKRRQEMREDFHKQFPGAG